MNATHIATLFLDRPLIALMSAAESTGSLSCTCSSTRVVMPRARRLSCILDPNLDKIVRSVSVSKIQPSLGSLTQSFRSVVRSLICRIASSYFLIQYLCATIVRSVYSKQGIQRPYTYPLGGLTSETPRANRTSFSYFTLTLTGESLLVHPSKDGFPNSSRFTRVIYSQPFAPCIIFRHYFL